MPTGFHKHFSQRNYLPRRTLELALQSLGIEPAALYEAMDKMAEVAHEDRLLTQEEAKHLRGFFAGHASAQELAPLFGYRSENGFVHFATKVLRSGALGPFLHPDGD